MQLATIIGNVGTTPEVRKTNDGQRSFVTFRIATDTKRTDPQTGITATDTLWWQVMHDESRFTGVRPYIVKGTKVCVYGHMTATPYQKKDGSLDPGLAIRAHSIELCGAKDETTQQPQQTAGGQPDNWPF